MILGLLQSAQNHMQMIQKIEEYPDLSMDLNAS